jgi:hypothetical protein
MVVNWYESTVHEEEKCILASGTFWLGFSAFAIIATFTYFSFMRDSTTN